MRKLSVILIGDAQAAQTSAGAISSVGKASSAIPIYGKFINAGLQAVAGITQAIAGSAERKKAQSMIPTEQDPMQVAQLNTLRNIRNTYTTGAEGSVYKDMVQRSLAQKMKAIGQQSGGATGAIMAGIAGADDKEQDAYNQILATLEKNRLGVIGMENQEVNDIAQRRLDIQNMRYNQMLGHGSGQLRTGQENAAAGSTQIVDNLFNSGLFDKLHPTNNAGSSQTLTQAANNKTFQSALLSGVAGGYFH